MPAQRVFISFDFDHDEDLRTLLVGQSRHPNAPFEISDWSVKDAMSGDWKAKVKTRIRQTDLVIVICGESTHTATGVSVELNIAREEQKPYFLLNGRSGKICLKPATALQTDKIYAWTWNNLELLLQGQR